MYDDNHTKKGEQVIVLQVFQTYEYIVNEIVSPAWDVSFGSSVTKLTMQDILSPSNTDEYGNPYNPWNKLTVQHKYTVLNKNNNSSSSNNNGIHALSIATNLNHKFCIDSEYLCVSHTEPYRFMKHNPHSDPSASKAYMGGKFKKFINEIDNGNKKTRQLVHTMQQIVYESYETYLLQRGVVRSTEHGDNSNGEEEEMCA